uniref:Uncharacterized protein n=1 Tax=Brassica oleracea TaxID=3712 RepID=A0A3P6DPY8_BRAOL|nr:unnamed protein product [Brassica oleracea]
MVDRITANDLEMEISYSIFHVKRILSPFFAKGHFTTITVCLYW